MAFKAEYVIESTGNYTKTYDEIRIRSDIDDSSDKVVRIEQGNDTILISEEQLKDFLDILDIIEKP